MGRSASLKETRRIGSTVLIDCIDVVLSAKRIQKETVGFVFIGYTSTLVVVAQGTQHMSRIPPPAAACLKTYISNTFPRLWGCGLLLVMF